MKLQDNPLMTVMHIAKGIERELSRGVDGDCEITHTDAKLLLMVHYHKESSQSDLADLLQVSAPAVSRQISKMEEAGYAERIPHHDNRRVTHIQLTPRGKQMAQQVEQYLEDTLNRLVTTLPPIRGSTHDNLKEVAGQLGGSCSSISH